MSPAARLVGPGRARFPRASGDEPPATLHERPGDVFSPRERG